MSLQEKNLESLTSAEMRALLSQAMREHAVVGKSFPLSSAQERLWFLERLEPGLSVYLIPCALRLRGELHVGALQRALGEIVRRHDILRTTYSTLNNDPVQQISPVSRVELAMVDLRELPLSEREASARQYLAAEMNRPFNLSTDLMLRAGLIRLGADDQILMLTIHHIASDGWSQAVLFCELASLYKAFVNGHDSPLPPLALQYVDYAVWQRQQLNGERLHAQLEYWEQQLRGAPAGTTLPTDRPRPAVQSFRGATQAFPLPKALSAAIHVLARE
jgi:hypothetical protein